MKRGQSQIITIILIILLVLLSIGIVGQIVNKIIRENSKEINVNNIHLELESAYINNDNNELQIKINRHAGKGELSLIKIIIRNSDDEYMGEIISELPKELETKIYLLKPDLFNLNNFNNIIEAELAYGINSSKKTILRETSEKIEDLRNENNNEENNENIIEINSCNGYYKNNKCIEVNCNMLINDSDIIINLLEDVVCDDYEEINISGSNITIDCNGHRFGGPIVIFGESGYNIIKNCEIHAKKFFGRSGYSRSDAIHVRDRARDENGWKQDWSTDWAWRYNIFENNVFDCEGSVFPSGIFEICCSYGDIIRNNTFFDCDSGIINDESHYLRIYDNIFYNCKKGISAGARISSGNDDIQNNTIHDCGIAISMHNSNNKILNNYIYNNEIGLDVSKGYSYLDKKNSTVFIDSEVRNNVFENNDINIKDYECFESYYTEKKECSNIIPETYTNNFEDTIINGKPIYYWYGEKDKIIENIELGYFSCSNCENIILRNVKLNEPNYYGMLLFNSHNITMESGEIKNSNYGVYLSNSFDCEINAVMENNVNFESIDSENNLCNEEDCNLL